jgi:hypothetical protein
MSHLCYRCDLGTPFNLLLFFFFPSLLCFFVGSMPSVSTPTPAAERVVSQPAQPGHPEYFDKIMSRFGHHLSYHQQSSLSQTLIPVLQTSRQGGLDSNKAVDDLSRPTTYIPSSTYASNEEERRKNAQELQRRQLAAAAVAANADTTVAEAK